MRKNFGELGVQVLITQDAVDDDLAPGAVGVAGEVHRELAGREILVERKRASPMGVHVIMGKHFFPGVSFDAEFEVAPPDASRHAALHEQGGHVVVEFLAREKVSPSIAWPVRAADKLGQGIESGRVVARAMTVHLGRDRRHDIMRAAVLREENFDARAGGLGRFDEDELVFVGNDHRGGCRFYQG